MGSWNPFSALFLLFFGSPGHSGLVTWWGGVIYSLPAWNLHMGASATKGLSTLGWFSFPWCFQVDHSCGLMGLVPAWISSWRIPSKPGNIVLSMNTHTSCKEHVTCHGMEPGPALALSKVSCEGCRAGVKLVALFSQLHRPSPCLNFPQQRRVWSFSAAGLQSPAHVTSQEHPCGVGGAGMLPTPKRGWGSSAWGKLL